MDGGDAPRDAMDTDGPAAMTAAGAGAVRGSSKPRGTERAERTAQRMLRPVLYCLLASILVNAALVALNISLFPLVRVQPALVQFDDRQFYKIEPIYAGSSAELKAREAFVRKYVVERETVNLVNDFERWKWIADQSTGPVFNAFIGRMEDDKTWARMERNDVRQSVQIVASWSLAGDPDRWAVECRRIKTRGYEETENRTWVAAMTLGRIGGRATDEEVFVNPFRLRVDRYSINAKADIEQEGQGS